MQQKKKNLTAECIQNAVAGQEVGGDDYPLWNFHNMSEEEKNLN